MNFASPKWLWLLLLLPALVALLIWSWRIKQRLLARFVGSRLLGALTTGVSKERQRVRLILFVVAIASLLVSLGRPRLGFSIEEARQRGLDIVVAIDTSKSMLADDVQPNRLQRAKLAALDLMRLAESDRLGLVAFAGSAFLQCPLSLDEEAFRQSVEFLDVNVIPQGGTALTEAIGAARAAFKDGSENHKVLVLFTDGEENEDQETVLSTAREAAQAGLRIFTVGVGTPAGEVLSTTDPYGNRVFIKDAQGNVVKSRLNEPLLQQLARETDGFYLPLTGARTMEVLYERGLAPLPKSEFSTRTIRQHHERFQWFIGTAIVLLLAEMLFPERARQSGQRRPGKAAAAAAAALLALLLSAPAAAGSASDARKSYERGQFGKARSEFERLARKSPEDARLRFNAGAAAFQEEDYETAIKHFSATLGSPDIKLMQQGLYNLGNSYFRLGEKEKEPGKMLEQWQQATNQFSLALKVDEKDPDSQYNLELVTRKIEELKKQQEQQQQQQEKKDDQKKDEQKDKNQENKDQKQQDKDKQQQEQKKEEEKSSEQQKQDQQKQDQEKKDQQQQQQSQPDQEQKKPDEAQSASQDQRGKEPNKGAEAANYNRVMAMTPQQAQQLLDAQKSEERAMIFQPQNLRTNRPPGDRVFKDW